MAGGEARDTTMLGACDEQPSTAARCRGLAVPDEDNTRDVGSFCDDAQPRTSSSDSFLARARWPLSKNSFVNMIDGDGNVAEILAVVSLQSTTDCLSGDTAT